MKTVFTDKSTVAHLWANQQQETARTGGNFYFNGSTIYSYGSHFPIAKHVTNNGQSAILFTERTYSNTTAKHIQVVRQAANHKNLIYCYSPDSSHEDNFKEWQRQAEKVAANLLKAKKPEKYLSELSHIAGRAQKYASFFGIDQPETLKSILSISGKNEFLQYKDKKEAYEKAEEAKRQRKAKAAHRKALKEWTDGKTHRLYTRDGRDYLRLNGENVETSQGVKIPMAIAERLSKRLKDIKPGEHILSYEVTEVGEFLQVGCHKYPIKYLTEKAKEFFNQ